MTSVYCDNLNVVLKFLDSSVVIHKTSGLVENEYNSPKIIVFENGFSNFMDFNDPNRTRTAKASAKYYS